MKEMMKTYWKPTPKKWRRLGDALLASATVIAIGGVWQFDSLKDIFTPTELKALIITSIGLGVVGKFLTNFFKEDTSEEK
jgi:xanthine/uracil permease